MVETGDENHHKEGTPLLTNEMDDMVIEPYNFLNKNIETTVYFLYIKS